MKKVVECDNCGESLYSYSMNPSGFSISFDGSGIRGKCLGIDFYAGRFRAEVVCKACSKKEKVEFQDYE